MQAGPKAGKVNKGKAVGNYNCEVPKSPNEAMEFLCRSWSPASTEFFNLFSSQVRKWIYKSIVAAFFFSKVLVVPCDSLSELLILYAACEVLSFGTNL